MKYNPTTQVWTNLSPLPHPLGHVRSVAIGGKIYAIGGGDNTMTNIPTKLAFVYTAATTQNTDDTISSCNCVSGSLACPSGQSRTIVPTSPTCILRANVKGAQDTDFILTGYDHLAGECTLSSVIPQAPQTASNQISVTA